MRTKLANMLEYTCRKKTNTKPARFDAATDIAENVESRSFG